MSDDGGGIDFDDEDLDVDNEEEEENEELLVDEGFLADDVDLPADVVNAAGPVASTVAKKDRITPPYLTRYERARVLGTRALQISMDAPVLVPLQGEMDPLEIAQKELDYKLIPMIIRRYLPDGSWEDWPLAELDLDMERSLDTRYRTHHPTS